MLIHSVLMRSIIAVTWNTMPKIRLLRKGFISLTLSQYCSSRKEVRTGSQTGNKPGGNIWCRDQGALLFTGLLIMVCSACFLRETSITKLGIVTLTNFWTLPHLSLIKKMPFSWILFRCFFFQLKFYFF